MPVHWFCRECWSEVAEEAVMCPVCGATLAGTRERSFVQKLIAALRHPEPETTVRAAQTLGELEIEEAIPALIEALGRSDDPYLLEAAASSLGRLGAAQAVPALHTVLRSSFLIVRLAAAKALGRIGTPEALAALEEGCHDRSERVRRAVAEQLVRWKTA